MQAAVDELAGQRGVLGPRQVGDDGPHGVGRRLQFARERCVVRRRLKLHVAAQFTLIHVHTYQLHNNLSFGLHLMT